MMVAAPWFGEFGWEVALWAPWLRHQKRVNYPVSELLVLCRAGHEHLYADFATEVVGFEPPLEITKVDCQNVWISGVRLRDWAAEVERLMRKRFPKNRVLHPDMMDLVWNPVPTSKKLDYAPMVLGEKDPGKFGAHMRACSSKQPERNWSRANWSGLLVDRLEFEIHQFVVFGTMNGAFSDEGLGMDFRGQSIRDVCVQMSECEFVVGPSSGPLHLANLCGTPVVWWSGNKKDVPRYEKTWNPFGCKNEQAALSWNPSTQEVADAIHRLQDRIRR